MLIRNTPELSSEIKTYSCASPNLKDFLINNEIYPIYQYTHNLSGKKIWVFIMCEDLSKLLKDWSNNNPNKKGGETIE